MSADLNPDIKVFPVCSECGVAYALKRKQLMNLTDGTLREDFVWVRDCKHKNAAAEAVDLRGAADGQGTDA